MSNYMFILEVMVIVFYIDIKYGTSNYKYVKSSEADYSAYYYIDTVNNEILSLKNVPEQKKIEVWKSSPIQYEVLDHFPNMQAMHEIYNDRVEDNGIFKKDFLHYMQNLQDAYIAGEIDEEKFKKLFLASNIDHQFI